MGSIILTLTTLFWVVVIAGGIPYIFLRQKKGAAKAAELQRSGALDMSRQARLAVYTSLVSLDGQSLINHTAILGRKPTAFMDAILLLVAPGEHQFEVASARRGDGDTFSAELEAGHTYQIGANEEGHYIVLDDADYQYKRVLAPRNSLCAGLVNTIF